VFLLLVEVSIWPVCASRVQSLRFVLPIAPPVKEISFRPLQSNKKPTDFLEAGFVAAFVAGFAATTSAGAAAVVVAFFLGGILAAMLAER
jgi:hypothetical protein